MAEAVRPLALDGAGCLSLGQILRSFSAPITEEHAWAVIHQAITCLGELEGREEELLLLGEAEQLVVSRDGLVHPATFTRPGPGRQRAGGRAARVAELGCVVYSALDYSLPEDNERILSAGLDNVIEMMVQADTEEGGEDDEGIGCDEETGVYYSDRSDALICGLLELCRHHLAVPGEAGPHYRAVCRALVTEALELSTFMESRLPGMDGELQHLNEGDWADVWTQVMSQLRRGIRLKKVDYSRTPAEYEMTPYEMIMDDVRTKKYRLCPVVAAAGAVQVRRDARDVILDFIRSRPPLKPANERQLKELKEEVTVHDSLLNDIRNSKTRQSLRAAPTRRPPAGLAPRPARLEEEGRTAKVSVKKVIELDDSFADHILNFEESPNNSSEEIGSPRASPVREVVERREEPAAPALVVSSPRRPSAPVQDPAPPPRTKYSDWIGRLHTLDLTLSEVSHMRYTMTKVELEEMELSPRDRAAYEKSKVCFCCHTVKFNLLNWAYPCEFCKRSVCSKCCAKIRLPSDKLGEIPVCCLGSQLEGEAPAAVASSTNNLATGLGPGFARSWDRLSLRGRPERSLEPVGGGALPSRPRLQRAKSMDKADVERFRALQLGGERVLGSRHNVCNDCRGLLTSIVRAQRHAANLKRMKVDLGGGLQAMGELEED